MRVEGGEEVSEKGGFADISNARKTTSGYFCAYVVCDFCGTGAAFGS